MTPLFLLDISFPVTLNSYKDTLLYENQPRTAGYTSHLTFSTPYYIEFITKEYD